MKNMIFDKHKKTFVPKPTQQELDFDCDKYHIEYDLIGTPEFLSPEVILGEEPTEAVDLWALGCIVYLFFHGETPFKDKNIENNFEKIRNCEYTLRSDLDPETQDLIVKLLEFDPKKRLSAFCSFMNNSNNCNKINQQHIGNFDDECFFAASRRINRNEIDILNDKLKGIELNEVEDNNNKNLYSNFIKGIKAHPYFKQISFQNLQSNKVPVDAEYTALHIFNNSINTNINDLSIFNSANNNMNFSKNNFKNLYYSPEITKKNKEFRTQNSLETIAVLPSAGDRISNVTCFTQNTSDSSFLTEANEDKSCNSNNHNNDNNLKASSVSNNSNFHSRASPFNFDEGSTFNNANNQQHERINLETEIYSSNNNFLNFLQEERRKSQNRLEKFYQEKSNNNSLNFKFVRELRDENVVVLEGRNFILYFFLVGNLKKNLNDLNLYYYNEMNFNY